MSVVVTKDVLTDMGVYIEDTLAVAQVWLSMLPEIEEADGTSSVALILYTGLPEYTMTALSLRQPRIQCLVRSPSYQVATTQMNAIYELLADKTDFLMNTVRYVSVAALDEPAMRDRDDRGRSTFVCNFDAAYQ